MLSFVHLKLKSNKSDHLTNLPDAHAYKWSLVSSWQK